MSSVDPRVARDHLAVLDRARRGTLTGPERAALAVLLDRLLIAALLDEEDVEEGRRVPSWREHVNEAYRGLLAVEAPPETAPPDGTVPRRQVGGAEVRALRAR